MEIFSIEVLIQNVENYQAIVTLLVAVAGIVIAIIRAIGNIYTAVMSTSIEVALMKKREQQRYQVSKCILLWFCFFFVFVYVGAFVLFSNMSHGTETQMELANTVENTEQDAESVSTNETTNANLQMEDTTSGGSEVIHAILFLLGLIGALCSCVGIIIFYIIRFIKRFLSLENRKKGKILVIFVICILYVIINIWVVMANNIWLLLGFVTLSVIVTMIICIRWKGVNKTLNTLKVIAYIFGFLLMFGFNNMFVWNPARYGSVNSLLLMLFESALLALLMFIYLSLVIDLNINPGRAKVAYYDEMLGKQLYLYFKYDDELLVTGEKKTIEECESYYLVKVEDVLSKALEKTTKETNDYSNICGENIVLQLEGKPDVVLNDVMKKLMVLLRKNRVHTSEYEKTKIYIKHNEEMVYFDLPSEKMEKKEQKFSISKDDSYL